MRNHPHRRPIPQRPLDSRGIYDEPMSLPRDARCPTGWRFWIVHPYLDRGRFQVVDAIVSCLHPQLGEALDRVADVMFDLVESGRIAGPVDGASPIVIWHPNGDVQTADGHPVTFAGCGGGFEPPMVVARGTHLSPSREPIRVPLPSAPTPGMLNDLGWTFGYHQPFVDSDTQIVELRVGTISPSLDGTLPALSAWLGDLVADGLLAEPSECLDVHVEFSVEPREDHIAAVARPCLSPEAGP